MADSSDASASNVNFMSYHFTRKTRGLDICIVLIIVIIFIFLCGALYMHVRGTVQCKTTIDCKHNAEKIECDAENGVCVECVTNMDCQPPKRLDGDNCTSDNICKCGTADPCKSPTPICATITDTPKCVQCMSDADCSSPTSTCNQETHACYGCNYSRIAQDPNQCAPGYVCSQDNLCIDSACTTEADCAPGQTCPNLTCTGKSTFKMQSNTDYSTAIPPEYLLSTTPGISLSECNTQCANNPACALFNWINKGPTPADAVCNQYLTTSSHNLDDLNKNRTPIITDGFTSWGGIKLNYQPIKECSGYDCVTGEVGNLTQDFYIPNTEFPNLLCWNSNPPCTFLSEIPDIASCMNMLHNFAECPSEPDQMAHAAIWNSEFQRCNVGTIDTADIKKELTNSNNSTTVIRCTSNADMPGYLV